MTDPRRSIPGVDRLLTDGRIGALAESHGRDWLVERVRGVLDEVRSGVVPVPDAIEGYAPLVEAAVELALRPSLITVINATGVVLHTNLGRAPLAEVAVAAMTSASGYGNVEFDLASGERGSRYSHCVDLICELTGAEDALVVNNNAAAVALALAALASGQDVVVSHGELVEIGGGFRIPAVIEGAGAGLMAVGTTNRTRLSDYAQAVDTGRVRAILKVHRSNFRVSGFTEETPLAELSGLAREAGVPLIHDLGSGMMVASELVGLPPEPRPVDSLQAGSDVVAFSGDKLLGGPQGGLLAGSSDIIARLRRHPLCRAFRVDKTTLAGLEATLRLYRDPQRAIAQIPVLRMLATPLDELRARAEKLLGRLPDGVPVTAGETVSVVGGGTYPGLEIPSFGVHVAIDSAASELAAALRAGPTPVVCRTRDDTLVVDLRTVAPSEDEALAGALSAGLEGR